MFDQWIDCLVALVFGGIECWCFRDGNSRTNRIEWRRGGRRTARGGDGARKQRAVRQQRLPRAPHRRRHRGGVPAVWKQSSRSRVEPGSPGVAPFDTLTPFRWKCSVPNHASLRKAGVYIVIYLRTVVVLAWSMSRFVVTRSQFKPCVFFGQIYHGTVLSRKRTKLARLSTVLLQYTHLFLYKHSTHA